MKLKDRTGVRYGRLVVSKRAENKACGKDRIYFVMWLCKCDCGKKVVVRAGSLEDGNTTSCGCYHMERLVSDATTHGKASHPIKNAWNGIFARCYNKKCSCYKFYGKKGIKICKRWNKFTNFLKDMEPSWKPGLTLERKNVYGDYRPGNCCWITRARQAVNKTSTKWITFRGERKALADWAKEFGFSRPAIITQRLDSGWPLRRALTTPSKRIFGPLAPKIS